MNIVVIDGMGRSLINFRGKLLAALVNQGQKVTACSPSEGVELIDKLSAMGVEYKIVPIGRTGMNPFKDLYSLYALYRLYRKIQPDIILAYNIKPVIFTSLLSRFLKKTRVYSVITGLGYVFTSKGLKISIIKKVVCFLYRLSLPNNGAVFFLNPDDIDELVNLKIIERSKAVLLNGEGIDLEWFGEVPANSKGPAFLLIARLIEGKGIYEYVEAARIVKRRHPHAVFRVLGAFDSNPMAIQPSKMEAWQREGVIDYLGKTKDVRPFIENASAFVLPSFYREGLPRSTLEAMAMGRPVITTDWPGCREPIVNGENGFLVPVKNVEALAAAMEQFISQPDLIQSMGKRSREIVEDKYDVNKVNQVIMETLGIGD